MTGPLPSKADGEWPVPLTWRPVFQQVVHAFVDLRTAEEGRSDMSLVAEVRESDAGYRFRVEGVWVE